MEWEKAARGTDGRRYPWGNTWEDGRCNAPPAIASTAADLPKSVAPAGSFPSGNSPYGVTDLAGNAREWINDEAAAASDAMATHGGSFLDPTAACVVTYRLRMPPLTRDMGSGFRCAADPVNDAP
jgi:formylglycine-generating enzyme required for sulfatase activity